MIERKRKIRKALTQTLLAALAAFVIVTLATVGRTVLQTGQRIMCFTNMEQLSMAVMMYTQDNSGCYPPACLPQHSTTTWRTLVSPYLKNTAVWKCQSRLGNGTGIDRLPISYAGNAAGITLGRRDGVFVAPNAKPVTIGQLPNPSSTILIVETDSATSTPVYDIETARPDPLWTGHRDNTANFAFPDGHVLSLPVANTYRTSGTAIQNWWTRKTTQPLTTTASKLLANGGTIQ